MRKLNGDRCLIWRLRRPVYQTALPQPGGVGLRGDGGKNETMRWLSLRSRPRFYPASFPWELRKLPSWADWCAQAQGGEAGYVAQNSLWWCPLTVPSDPYPICATQIAHFKGFYQISHISAFSRVQIWFRSLEPGCWGERSMSICNLKIFSPNSSHFPDASAILPDLRANAWRSLLFWDLFGTWPWTSHVPEVSAALWEAFLVGWGYSLMSPKLPYMAAV